MQVCVHVFLMFENHCVIHTLLHVIILSLNEMAVTDCVPAPFLQVTELIRASVPWARQEPALMEGML